MKKFTADYIFPVSSEPLQNGVITIDDLGKIINIEPGNTTSLKDAVYYRGVIVPGFINAHTHLELSHLKEKIKPGSKLVSFIKQILALRKTENNIAIEAIKAAEQEMYNNGIVGVGDIVNENITADIKLNSKLKFHNFVEMLGFDPAKSKEIFNKALDLKEEFDENSSLALHAPYTISKDLLKNLRKYCEEKTNLVSIHNQESEEENKLFRYKTGDMVKMYEDLGIDISHFKPQARNSVQTYIPLLEACQRILLVHNTFTSLKDIYFIRRFERRVTWCFCPNANLYIEGALPKIDLFRKTDFSITLGTDSLASNTRLCILEEMKTVSAHFPHIPFSELLNWATINGALFFGWENTLGSLEIGKTPGLNLLSNFDGITLTKNTAVQKLA